MTLADLDEPDADAMPVWPRAANEALRAAICAVVLLNLLNVYAIAAGPQTGGRTWLLLDGESNPMTWLSTLVLAACALLAWASRELDSERRRVFWGTASLTLLGMSFDEVATVHEKVGGNVGVLLGDEQGLAYLWIVPAAVAAAAVLGLLWRTRPGLPPQVRNQLLFGGLLTVGAAAGLEACRPLLLGDYSRWSIPVLSLTSVEENLEMIGALIVLRSLMGHLDRVCDRGQRAHDPVGEPPAR